MTKPFGAARRAVFLRALAETGNFTLAAARAKVSRSWVTLHRAEDAGFRAAGDAAVAEARARLIAHGEGTAAPAKWGHQGGAALVVRGTNGRRVQIAQARMKQWDPAAEERFLGALRTTCNVKAACAAAGLSQASAYGIASGGRRSRSGGTRRSRRARYGWSSRCSRMAAMSSKACRNRRIR